jgi:hypothetical protein
MAQRKPTTVEPIPACVRAAIQFVDLTDGCTRPSSETGPDRELTPAHCAAEKAALLLLEHYFRASIPDEGTP